MNEWKVHDIKNNKQILHIIKPEVVLQYIDANPKMFTVEARHINGNDIIIKSKEDFDRMFPKGKIYGTSNLATEWKVLKHTEDGSPPTTILHIKNTNPDEVLNYVANPNYNVYATIYYEINLSEENQKKLLLSNKTNPSIV